MTRPLFRWAGGKQKQLAVLRAHLPEQVDFIVEPFAGAASLTMSLDCLGLLYDANRHLMNCYREIQRYPRVVLKAMEYLCSMTSDPKYTYLVLRDDTDGETIRAEEFLFLMHYAYGGMWRENRAGRMNVPFARRKPIDMGALTERVMAVHHRLQNVCLDSGSHLVLPRDTVVYIDPPYVGSGHNAYTRRPITAADVHESVCAWHSRAFVMVSHPMHPEVDAALTHLGFERTVVDVTRTVAKTSRPKQTEMLYWRDGR